MEKIKVLIVEDSSIIAEDIAMKIKRNNMDVMHSCSSAEEAIEYTQTHLPDVILMDIHLSDALDGIAAAKIIKDTNNIPVIYLSDYTDKETVQRAKRTYPGAYLAKPFHEADLIRTIELVYNNAKASNSLAGVLKDYIFIKENDAHVKVSYKDILYLEAGRSYCNVVTENKTYIQSNSMNHVLDQLDHKDFVRVHRSHVVNINKITEIEGNIVRLGKHEVEMSKTMRDYLLGRVRFLK